MATFKWKPAPGASYTCKPSVDKASYGDGYEQRVGLSINPMPKKWSLKFVKEIAAVVTFLETHAGVAAFNWTDPMGVGGVYVCREWKATHVGGDQYELSCDFEQQFEAGVPV